MNQTHVNLRARWMRSGLISILLGLVVLVLSSVEGCAPATIPATPTNAPSITRASQPTSPTLPAATQSGVGAIVAPTAVSQVIIPQPNCSNGITPAQTEGPFYKANTPERASLLQTGMGGTKVTVTGIVLTRDCKPVARAWLDFWQANDKGEYDNSGYTLRGHQFTDANGRYSLETILPGLYTGRTRHIHVKVQAPNQPSLTTQLYFPEEKQNSADGIYDAKLLVTWQNTSERKIALYNFVLNQ